MNSLRDPDPIETAEWREAFAALLQAHGPQRARQMLDELAQLARGQRIGWTPRLAMPYVNTIAVDAQPAFPGDLAVEKRLASPIRLNALAMVVRANHLYGELGGHIASYASAADLFEAGLTDRRLLDCSIRKVWGVFRNGEMDWPELMSTLTLAARKKLDNLVWVVNSNLQRLDGPVRGNGRIIGELEKLFAGAR